MLFFNANFICYYFYPTKKREEPEFFSMFKCTLIRIVPGIRDESEIFLYCTIKMPYTCKTGHSK